jgi:hypothetical protein
LGDRSGRLLVAIVSANRESVAVPFVGRKFDSKHLLASDVVLVASAEELGGFTREHAAHDEFDATALPLLGRQEWCPPGRLLGLDWGDPICDVWRSQFAGLDRSDRGCLEFFGLLI